MPGTALPNLAVLRIGAFARRASVSIKTLRFYDRVGVFRPAYVDPRSGYRYYEVNQLRALRELRLLRELGCSIAALQAWGTSARESAGQTALLTTLRNRLQHQLTQDRQRLRLIDRWIQSAGQSWEHLIPTVRGIPPIACLTMRDHVRTVSTAVYKMFEAAERAAARQQARVPAEPFLLLHDGEYRSANANIEVCIPVHPASLGAVSGRVVEGIQRAACLGFVGSYEHALATHAAIRGWMQITGAQPAGPLRETYLRFGADQRGYRLPKRFVARSVGEYRTELQVPLVNARTVKSI